MKKFFFFAMFVAAAMTCAAANESENVENAAEPEIEAVAEASEMNTAEAVLEMIDGNIMSRGFYLNEERELFVVEYGERMIRVRDFSTGKLVSTLSIYLNKENGDWIEGANSVICYEGRFYPAKRILNGKGITYKGAKHAQRVEMKRVRSVEREYQIWL